MLEFGNGLDGWILILLFGVAILVTYLQYGNSSKLPAKSRIIAAFLRLSSLLILIVLLSDLTYKSREFIHNKKSVLIYRDISQSMDSLNRNSSFLRDIESQLHSNFGEFIEFNTVVFGSDVSDNKLNNDELITSNGLSRFTDFGPLVEYHNDIQPSAAIFISDGIQTKGIEPFLESKSNSPVLSILTGDTTVFQSFSIVDIVTPDQVYAKRNFNLRTIIDSYKMNGEKVKLEVYDQENKLLDGQEVSFNLDRQRHAFISELNFAEIDESKLIKIRLSSSSKVIERQLSVAVLDNSTNVTLLSYVLHPDVGALNNLLRKLPSIRLSKQFIDSNSSIDLSLADSVDLIIAFANSTQVNGIINSNPAKSFIFFISNLNTQANGFLTDFEYSVEASDIQDFNDLLPERLSNLPPLSSYPSYNLSSINLNDFQPLIMGNIKELSQQIPLAYYSISSTNNSKAIVFASDKWFRWLNYPDKELNQQSAQFFQAILKWVTATNEQQIIDPIEWPKVWYDFQTYPLQVLTKNKLGEVDPSIQLSYQLVDSLGQTLEEAFAEKNTQSGINEFSIKTSESGFYSLRISAKKNAKVLQEREFNFYAESSNAEIENTIASPRFLEKWSDQTGGVYLGMISQIENTPDILDEALKKIGLNQVNRQEQILTYRFRSSAIWFILLVITLSAEWYLRRTKNHL